MYKCLTNPRLYSSKVISSAGNLHDSTTAETSDDFRGYGGLYLPPNSIMQATMIICPCMLVRAGRASSKAELAVLLAASASMAADKAQGPSKAPVLRNSLSMPRNSRPASLDWVA